jgi:guanine deaminase
MNPYMKLAIKEAETGLKKNHGGPFGAVIIKNNQLVAKAHNQVILTNDPTAHAEIVAIRKASRVLKSFHLTGCEIYSTCEPCPMCLAAIRWAHLERIFYGCSRLDAEKIGFIDNEIYEYLQGKIAFPKDYMNEIDRLLCLPLFDAWEKINKLPY